MNSLLKFALQRFDARSAAQEAKLEAEHRIPESVEEFLDIPFRGAEGNLLAVDIFRPKERGTGPLPVVIMVHGGGLVVCTRKISRTFCENLVERGFLVFAPEYRRVPEADALEEIGDVFSAFSFISGVLRKYGGDPDRVAVASESAGSFLSVYAVAASNSPVLREVFGLPPAPSLHIRALACFSGMFYTSRKDGVGLVYSRNIYGEKHKDPAFMQYMDPEHPEVTNNLPPVFLVGSDADFLNDYTKRYANALQQAGHPSKLVYYSDNKELTHAFPALKPELPESRDVRERLAEWLRQQWGEI